MNANFKNTELQHLKKKTKKQGGVCNIKKDKVCFAWLFGVELQ